MARVKGDTWEGESDALLAELNDIVGEAIQQNRQWPKAPHVLSRRMNRVMGVLRKIGIEIKGGYAKKTNRRTWTITQEPKYP
jgi:hypothetical protein